MNIKNYGLISSYSSLEDAFMGINSDYAKKSIFKELEKKLIIQRYLESYKFYPEDPARIIRDFCQVANIKNENELNSFLANTGQDRRSFVERLIYQNQLERLKEIVVTRDDINSFFIRSKPKQDSVLFSLIRLSNGNLAKEIYYRIKDDLIDFGELAKQFSEGQEAMYGGIVGPTSISTLNPEIRNILMNLKEGELKEPFQIDNSHFLILKLIRYNQFNLNPQVEESIKNEIFEIWLERQVGLYQNSSNVGEETN